MKKLAIGTANFGMEYGFKNSRGKLNSETVKNLLDYAWSCGINTLDTAKGYGESESVIGNYLTNDKEKTFNIITKINTVNHIEKDLLQSLINLKQTNIYGFLIHHFHHLKSEELLLKQLLQFKENGNCSKIGVSLYYPEELQYILDNNIPIDLIQIAYSIFDRRFEKFFPILKSKNIEIHIRSVFLQGLFFTKSKDLVSHFDSIKHKIDAIQQLSNSSGLGIASLCLNFATNNKYIDKIVIGADSLSNLKSSVQVLSEKEKVKHYMESLSSFAEEDVNILFPHFWKL